MAISPPHSESEAALASPVSRVDLVAALRAVKLNARDLWDEVYYADACYCEANGLPVTPYEWMPNEATLPKRRGLLSRLFGARV